MSLELVMKAAGNDVKGFLAKLSADYQTARQAWLLISSPQTRALAFRITGDVLTAAKDAAEAASAGGINVALDAATVADVKQLIADAKAGDGVIQADLKVLGVTI